MALNVLNVRVHTGVLSRPLIRASCTDDHTNGVGKVARERERERERA